MGAAIPLLMKTPRSCHLSVPPKASPGPVLVPMPCDDLREYRRDPATRQSPEVGILPRTRCRQPYAGGRELTAAASAAPASGVPAAVVGVASPDGEAAGGSAGAA